MRTAGIDFDMGRVVICSIPLGGTGIKDAVFTEELIKRDASVDLALRYKLLHNAAREAWSKHRQYAVTTDVLSVSIEVPGGHSLAKMYGAYAAVAAATPIDVALSSMSAAEWKKTLGLSPNKLIAHDMIYDRYLGEWTVKVDEHATDALCLALAWRQMQQAADG
jgi:hypothetical protein